MNPNQLIPPFFYKRRLFPFLPRPVRKQDLVTRRIENKIPQLMPKKINMFISQKNRAELYKKMMLKYGKCRSIFVSNELFITAFSPEMVYQITVEQKEKFLKGNGWNRIRKFAGEGLLTSEEPTHTQHRKIMQPSFTHKKIQGYFDIMIEKTSSRIDEWLKTPNKKVDVHSEMVSLTLEIVAESLFGINLKSDTEVIRKNMNTAVNAAERTVAPALHRYDFSNLPIFKDFRDASIKLHEFSLKLIEQRMNNPVDGDDLLNVLIKSRNNKDNPMSFQEISDEVLTIILAGFETTANALTFTIAYINDSPIWYRLLTQEAQEIMKHYGKEDFMERVSKAEICTSIIKETLRISPPLWVMPRLALEDSVIDGNFIPRGAAVIMSTYPIHHDPEIYEYPEMFMPQRWNNDFEKGLPRGAYIPFGLGQRKCMGDQFAMLEMKVILLMIANKIKLETTRKAPKGAAKASYRTSRPVKAKIKPIDL
jgi:cytochrome P450